MDFDNAAKCMRELQSLKAHAQGAAHQLECDVTSSEELSAEEKDALRQTISRVFLVFGKFDSLAFDELHQMLMKHESYVRAWMKQTLQGQWPAE